MPSLPAIHAVCASRQAIARNGRFVPASCRSQVSPPSAVWKMRPSSPTIQPSRSVAKQVPKRPWRISRRLTGVARAEAASGARRRSAARASARPLTPWPSGGGAGRGPRGEHPPAPARTARAGGAARRGGDRWRPGSPRPLCIRRPGAGQSPRARAGVAPRRRSRPGPWPGSRRAPRSPACRGWAGGPGARRAGSRRARHGRARGWPRPAWRSPSSPPRRRAARHPPAPPPRRGRARAPDRAYSASGGRACPRPPRRRPRCPVPSCRGRRASRTAGAPRARCPAAWSERSFTRGDSRASFPGQRLEDVLDLKAHVVPVADRAELAGGRGLYPRVVNDESERVAHIRRARLEHERPLPIVEHAVRGDDAAAVVRGGDLEGVQEAVVVEVEEAGLEAAGPPRALRAAAVADDQYRLVDGDQAVGDGEHQVARRVEDVLVEELRRDEDRLQRVEPADETVHVEPGGEVEGVALEHLALHRPLAREVEEAGLDEGIEAALC